MNHLCLLERGLANTYNLIWKKKKHTKTKTHTSSLLECDCFGNSNTQPVTPALPAFLVLLGEGRHPGGELRSTSEGAVTGLAL